MLARAIFSVLGLVGCAPTPKHPIPVAVLVDGDRAAFGALPQVDGLDLRPVVLPASPAEPTDTTTAVVARARSAYAKGELDSCHDELATLDVPKLLAARQRSNVARVLVLDAACTWAAMDKSAAKVAATRLAAFGLELPDLAVSPDVEQLIGSAVATAGTTKRIAVAVEGIVGARLSVDGREAACALPCTVDLVPGDHVFAVDADGYQRAVKLVRIPETARVVVEQQAAPPELAAGQWRARVGRGQPAADAIGASLIGRFAGESRVAFVHADKQLTGALVVAGKSVATAVRERGASAELFRELAYDGGVLHRPALWQRPTFWIVTSTAVVLVAGAIVFAVYEPDRRTRLVTP